MTRKDSTRQRPLNLKSFAMVESLGSQDQGIREGQG